MGPVRSEAVRTVKVTFWWIKTSTTSSTARVPASRRRSSSSSLRCLSVSSAARIASWRTLSAAAATAAASAASVNRLRRLSPPRRHVGGLPPPRGLGRRRGLGGRGAPPFLLLPEDRERRAARPLPPILLERERVRRARAGQASLCGRDGLPPAGRLELRLPPAPRFGLFRRAQLLDVGQHARAPQEARTDRPRAKRRVLPRQRRGQGAPIDGRRRVARGAPRAGGDTRERRARRRQRL